MKVEKSNLRARILAQLKDQTQDQIRENGERVLQRLDEKLIQINAQSICAYLPMTHELPLDAWMAHWTRQGRTVYVPQQAKIGQAMTWILWTAQQEWNTDRWGIRVPVESKECELPNLSKLDAVIVPAVAFGLGGERLGYGGGFYDRFIHSIREAEMQNAKQSCLLLGAGFELQFQAEIPTEPHDQRVDWLIHQDASFAAAGK